MESPAVSRAAMTKGVAVAYYMAASFFTQYVNKASFFTAWQVI